MGGAKNRNTRIYIKNISSINPYLPLPRGPRAWINVGVSKVLGTQSMGHLGLIGVEH